MSKRDSAAPAATRGKTVGRALIRSYVHDWVHRHDADYKPLYTQAQFNRMVSGLKSEHEHRVYTQFVALYHGIVEAYARVQGYYQQAQNALGRLCTYAWDALRSEALQASFEALLPSGENAGPQDIPWCSGADILLRALAYYLARPMEPTPALVAPLEAYRADRTAEQVTWLPEDGDVRARYEALCARHPALLEALGNDMAKRGVPLPPADRMFEPLLSMSSLAVLDVYDYAQEADRLARSPAQAGRYLSGLSLGLDDIGRQPAHREQIHMLYHVLLLPALSGMWAYNLLLDTVAKAYQLPELSALSVNLSDTQNEMSHYNALCRMLPQRVRGSQADRVRRERIARETFLPVFMPLLNRDILGEVQARAAKISTFEHTPFPQLLSLLQESALS